MAVVEKWHRSGGTPPLPLGVFNIPLQCMKIAIRMMTGIGTPSIHSSRERMMFFLVG